MLSPGGFSWPWECLHYEVLAWYDHWLKGRDTGVMEGPPIRYQVPGVEGWRTTAEWPPPESRLTPFALCADGVLAPRKASPAAGNISISRLIRANRPTPIRPNCRRCSVGRRCRSMRTWSSRGTSSSRSTPESRPSTHPGSPSSTTRRRSASRKRSPPDGFARPSRRRRDAERARRAGSGLPHTPRGSCRRAGFLSNSGGSQRAAHCCRSSLASRDRVRRRDRQDANHPRLHPRRRAGSKPEHDLQCIAALASPSACPGGRPYMINRRRRLLCKGAVFGRHTAKVRKGRRPRLEVSPSKGRLPAHLRHSRSRSATASFTSSLVVCLRKAALRRRQTVGGGRVSHRSGHERPCLPAAPSRGHCPADYPNAQRPASDTRVPEVERALPSFDDRVILLVGHVLDLQTNR